MENVAQQSRRESPHGATLLSGVLFVTVAAMVAAPAHCLIPGLGIPQMGLPGWEWVALAVLAMMLVFSGVLVSTLLDLPETTRGTLVLFATALLCSAFGALVGWFAMSGASSRWL
ncbi:MAG TPA: hypothetical protein VFR76_05015 [Verrucomicrobiae bacterium]|nr:hypothetical protein [Verrucomicrobiae bacterium]